MIGMSQIEEIIKLALWSPYIENGDGIYQSLGIIGETESGKSVLVKQYESNDGIVFPSDATCFGIIRDYKLKLMAGTLKHFVFPEFIFPISRQKETVQTFMAFLNSLMAEGVTDISTYSTKLHLSRPLKAGVILCLARDEFAWRQRHWLSTGFLTRFIPVTYTYSARIEDAIFEGIFNEDKNIYNMKMNFHRGKVHLPRDIAASLRTLARGVVADYRIKKSEERRIAGYRAQESLQRMIKALALSESKDEVDESHLLKIIGLSKYMNLKYNEL